MNRKWARRMAIAVVGAMMLSHSSMAAGMPRTIWETKETERLSTGVVHEHLQRFTAQGWWNVNVVRVNLSNPNNRVVGLYSEKGVGTRDSVKNMVEKSGALVGINADFFNKNSTSLSAMVRDGRVLSSVGSPDKFPSFVLDRSNLPSIQNMDLTINLTNDTQYFTIPTVPYNRWNSGSERPISILDRNWGDMSVGQKQGNDVLEVVVQNGVVTDVRNGQPAVRIPDDGYVITVVGEGSKRGMERTQPGDRISLNFSSAMLDRTQLSIGGGSVILQNGTVTNTGLNIKGLHPRTALGISADGQELIFVTIDGRGDSLKGVEQTTLGGLMKELGAWNAINFDGGGSTNMAIQRKGETQARVVNRASESNRKVINGLGVQVSQTPIGAPEELEIKLSDEKMFIYSGRKVEVAAYDGDRNKISVAPGEYTLSVEGVKGVFQGDTFVAKSAGVGKIVAQFGNIIAERPIRVLENIADVEAEEGTLFVEAGGKVELPAFIGTDVNGVTAKLETSEVGLTVQNDIGYVDGNFFYAGDKPNTGAITAKFGNGIDNILVHVGSQKKPLKTLQDPNDFSVTAYPNTVTASGNPMGNSVLLQYDFTKGTETRAAYLHLLPNAKEKGLLLPEGAIAVGMTVGADGNGGWLRGVVSDSENREYIIDFAKVADWMGEKYVEAYLPSVPAPLRLKRIYVAETEALNQYAGQITIRDLTANFPVYGKSMNLPKESNSADPKFKKATLPGSASFAVANEPTVLNDKLKFTSQKKLAGRIASQNVLSMNGFSKAFGVALAGRNLQDGNGKFYEKHLPNAYLLSLTAQKGSLWTTNVGQWDVIQRLSQVPEKNILISLDKKVFGSDSIVDKMEAKLLHQYLKELVEQGKNVVVMEKSPVNYSVIRDGVRYLQVYRNTIHAKEDFAKITVLNLTWNAEDFVYWYERPFAQ